MKILELSIALLIGLGSFSYANEIKDKTVIILDASGSMWGQKAGKTKMDIAKKSLRQFVKEWDESKEGELGITVYGHRKMKDCQDIEAIVPIGKVNKNVIYSKINKIQPKGKTPISLSLEKVAAELKGNDGMNTIILFSDGKDSCNADPCKTVKKLKNEGLNFVSHVIAMDVKGDENEQLECIANEGGGIIVKADKPQELRKAMITIKEKIEEEKVPKEISATEDDFSKNTINSRLGGKLGNILNNDTFDNKKADSTMLDITMDDNSNIKLNKEGDLSVNKDVKAKKYTIEYEICEKRKIGNCSSSKVSFVVKDITNTNIVSEQNGVQISASYKFFTMKKGEADEKLDHECTSNESEPCTLDLKKGNYLILSTAGSKKGEALITIEKDQALKENDIQKITVNLK